MLVYFSILGSIYLRIYILRIYLLLTFFSILLVSVGLFVLASSSSYDISEEFDFCMSRCRFCVIFSILLGLLNISLW